MTRPFEVSLPSEPGYTRTALFGIELLDAVTLERVSQGVKVVAEGLRGKPFTNNSGIFVWPQEDFDRLRKVTIDPGVLPYQGVELAPAEVERPVMRVELSPRLDYPFAAGVTGIRGALIEERVVPAVPVLDAEVRLRWLDEDSAWRDAPAASRTNGKGGGFAATIRFSPADAPLLDAGGALTVRLRALRNGDERESADLKLPQGRIADALLFAWDELQP